MNSTKMASKIIRVLSLALLISLIASTCIAATYYVDKNNPSASDSNSGSESSPFKTFQKGVNVATAGDTVFVKAGVYYEYISARNSGKQGAPITFKNYKNDVVTIDGSNHSEYRVVYFGNNDYIVWDGIDVKNGSTTGLWIKGLHNIIQNSEIAYNGTLNGSGHTGLTITDSDYCIVRNNHVHHNGWNGINYQHSDNGIIEYNIAHDNPGHFGIQLYVNAGEVRMYKNNTVRFNIMYNNESGLYLRYQQNNEVSNNLIYNNTTDGIKIARKPGDEVVAPYEGHTKIFNNTITNNGDCGIRNEMATHLIIKNNIISNHNGYAIDEQQNSGTHIIDNNLYFNNSKGFKTSTSYSSLSSFRAGTGYETNGLTGDPLFNDVAKKDYSLKLGSAAIDSGENLSSVSIEGLNKDLAGAPRPQGQGFDVGAYEYGAGATSLTAPKNLRIQTF